MANDVGNSRFRYVDADDLKNATVDLDDLDVRNDAGDKLGEVDGFIVDAASERPYYVVVSSGGWFSGGEYLVPINHTRLEQDRKKDEDVLRVNLDKDTIKKYPRFDKDEFARLSDDQLREFETKIGQACCPGQATSATAWTYESVEHYRQPDWWLRSTRPASGARAAAGAQDVRPAEPARPRSLQDRERVVARESQPAGDRAEPGDVLGIETGGEETHLGDTPEEERQRVQVSDREARQAEKNNRG